MAKTNEELREEITNIMLAHHGCEFGSPEHRAAYQQLSLLEEQIADMTEPRDEDGCLSRWGAVAAATISGDMDRARALAKRFMAQQIPQAIYHGISYMVGDAMFPPPSLFHLLPKMEEAREAGLDELSAIRISTMITQDMGGYPELDDPGSAGRHVHE